MEDYLEETTQSSTASSPADFLLTIQTPSPQEQPKATPPPSLSKRNQRLSNGHRTTNDTQIK